MRLGVPPLGGSGVPPPKGGTPKPRPQILSRFFRHGLEQRLAGGKGAITNFGEVGARPSYNPLQWTLERGMEIAVSVSHKPLGEKDRAHAVRVVRSVSRIIQGKELIYSPNLSRRVVRQRRPTKAGIISKPKSKLEDLHRAIGGADHFDRVAF